MAFWRLTIETLAKTLEEHTKQTYWFSTDGTGVKWLHMRIDPKPKYYDYEHFAKDGRQGGRDRLLGMNVQF